MKNKQSMGGEARSKTLSPEQRKAIAQEAARKRWASIGEQEEKRATTPVESKAGPVESAPATPAKATADNTQWERRLIASAGKDSKGRIAIRAAGAGFIRCRPGTMLASFYLSQS